MQFLAIYLYVMAVGFVAAGLLASFVQLVSGEPMRFGIEPKSILASLGGVLLRVLAGPAILMRNAWRGLAASGAPEDLVRRFRGHRRRLEPVLGRRAARSDLDAVSRNPQREKKEPASLQRPALVKARWGRGWVGDDHRASKRPVGTGVSKTPASGC